MSTTIRLRHLTRRDFDVFFQLDSPGYYIAKEAFRAGEAKTAVEALEILCLANKLYESELFNRLAEELGPYGKTAEYVHAYATDAGTKLALRTLGKNRLVAILREVMDEVRRQARGGTGENPE